MKHVIRVDLEVDEEPIDEGEGVAFPYSHAAALPLAKKYADMIGEKLGISVDPDMSVRVFVMREAVVEDGEVKCPNGHTSFEYFEDVYSTRDVEVELKDGVMFIGGDSTEHDGEPDILDFFCQTCNVAFTMPSTVEVDYR